MNLHSKEDAKRTASPLTPALSPLRGEGEGRTVHGLNSRQILRFSVSMKHLSFVVRRSGRRSASDRLKPALRTSCDRLKSALQTSCDGLKPALRARNRLKPGHQTG